MDKKAREDYRRKIEDYRKKLNELIQKCPHWFKELTEAELNDKWMSVGATCKMCHKSFGWRCKDSPDSVCHYFTTTDRDGVRCVELSDGTLDHNFPRTDGVICFVVRIPSPITARS